MNVKKLVEKNLFFQIDFDSKYTKKKGEKIKQIVKFFFIGVLPIALEFPNGKIERSVLKTAIEVKQDKYLRLLHGVRFNKIIEAQQGIFDKFKVKVDYLKEAKEISKRTAEAIQKTAENKKFIKKEIKDIKIINIDTL